MSKVIIITGASSGLGAATAVACANAGHQVVLAARREARLHDLAASIGKPDDTLALRIDVRHLEDIETMVTATLERFGRIDALFANAGVGESNRLQDVTEEELLWQTEVNFLGVIRCARAVLPHMLERRSGHILTTSSVAGDVPTGGLSVYAATKGGVTAFTEALRREVAAHGIKVTHLVPGFIESEMTMRNKFPMPPASTVGDLVVKLLEHPRRRAVIPRYYGAGIWANRLLPWAIDPIIMRLQKMFERE